MGHLVGTTGVIPCGTESPADCADRYYRAIAVVEIVNSGDTAVQGAELSGFELLDATGRVESRMRDEATLTRLDAVALQGPVLLPGEPMPGTDVARSYLSQDGWQLLFAQGTVFDGVLPTGRTWLRIEVWLDHTPHAEPLRWRLGLVFGEHTLVIEDQVAAGSWDTA
jgi:hypothetical protein